VGLPFMHYTRVAKPFALYDLHSQPESRVAGGHPFPGSAAFVLAQSTCLGTHAGFNRKCMFPQALRLGEPA
jgi:hypothetical protein